MQECHLADDAMAFADRDCRVDFTCHGMSNGGRERIADLTVGNRLSANKVPVIWEALQACHHRHRQPGIAFKARLRRLLCQR